MKMLEPPPVNKHYSSDGKLIRSGFDIPIAKNSMRDIITKRLVERQLAHLLGELKLTWRQKLWRLYPEDVEQLALDLLGFNDKSDLIAWFKENHPGKYRPPE